MPTKLRIQSATAFQHVTARGNNKQDIFFDAEDRLFYLELMEIAIKEYSVELVAYCLMRNHVHMLARFAGLNMDRAMFLIQCRYAKHFNRRYARTGHLYGRRYDNKIVLKEDYLHEAGRYIHNNPVVENIVERPEDYVWSSFREYWNEDYRFVSKDSPLVTCFSPGGAFDRQAFHDFTTARKRSAVDEQWYEKKVYRPTQPNGDPLLQEAADRNHPVVRLIVSKACQGFGYWDDFYDPAQKCRARDSARMLILYLLKEALPAWTFERLRGMAGYHSGKNVCSVYRKCEYRMAFDPGFRHVAADVRAALKGVKV